MEVLCVTSLKYPAFSPCSRPAFSARRSSPFSIRNAAPGVDVTIQPDHSSPTVTIPTLSPGLGRRSFPKDFIFGAASSAFQFEGALDVDGRSPSIWDTWAKVSGKIADGSIPDITCDQYYKFQEHVQLIKNLGLNAYRLSISWPRLMNPKSGHVNTAGLLYYHSLIQELVSNGIEPFVTLYHWDHPQLFEDAPTYGWLNKDGTMVEKFVEFADLCFAAFGHQVKKWTTFNEPWSVVFCGYVNKEFPPGGSKDPSRDPYIATHNILLAHSAAVRLYRTKYQNKQKGEIGITLNSTWSEPLYETSNDWQASRRSIDFELGWFLNPIVYGTYPKSMREYVRDRLPTFSKEQSDNLKGSFDFLGINYYTAKYISNVESTDSKGYNDDIHVSQNFMQGDALIGPFPPGFTWSDGLPMVPWGFFKLLNHIHSDYKSPTIYVTENGVCQKKGDMESSLNDHWRVKYFATHIDNMHCAIKAGINIKGYFTWALFDNWEWHKGYTVTYGMVYNDPTKPFDPRMKKSALWYQKFLQN